MMLANPSDELIIAMRAHLAAMTACGAFDARSRLDDQILTRMRYAPELDPSDRIRSDLHIFHGSDNVDIPSMVRAGYYQNVPSEVIAHQFTAWIDCFTHLFDDRLFGDFFVEYAVQLQRMIADSRAAQMVDDIDFGLIIPSIPQDRCLTDDPVDAGRRNHEGATDALHDNEAAWVLHVFARKPELAITFHLMKGAIQSYCQMLCTVAASTTVSDPHSDPHPVLDAGHHKRLQVITDNVDMLLRGPFWDRMIAARFCLIHAARVGGDMTQPVNAQDFRSLIDYLRTSNFRGQAEQIDHGLRHVFHCPFHATFNRLMGFGARLHAAHRIIEPTAGAASAIRMLISQKAQSQLNDFLTGGNKVVGFLPPLLAPDAGQSCQVRPAQCPHANAE